MTLQSHKELIVWQKSLDLVEMIYQHTQSFPQKEMYGLVSQMRRASISIPSNIAEGASRSTTKDFLRYLSIAYASLAELETQVIIAMRLGYLTSGHHDIVQNSIAEIARMLNGLQRKLEHNLITDHRPLTTT